MLVLDDRTKIDTYTIYETGTNHKIDIYNLETRYGLSTREVTVCHSYGGDAEDEWYGDMIAFGEQWNIDEEEVEQAKQFLEEKGYLSNEGRNADDTQQSVGQ